MASRELVMSSIICQRLIYICVQFSLSFTVMYRISDEPIPTIFKEVSKNLSHFSVILVILICLGIT